MRNRIEQLVEQLKLIPHPEGGYYRETYRSEGQIKPDSLDQSMSGERNYSTAIYFLLTSENFSAFHRIKSDEVWHFYDGSAIQLHEISPQGEYRSILIGPDLKKNHQYQYVVPANHWFAAVVSEATSYALVGCTVSPGFDFADFELVDRSELIREFPQHTDLICKFTRDN
ncbi:MAG: cupin domain-containing protein [Calditrichaeota bacterium]|nr:cupin domain-containing protein [Calditrichota bacterium]